MELEQYRIYSEMARGIRKAPLVLKNANIFMHIQVSSAKATWLLQTD